MPIDTTKTIKLLKEIIKELEKEEKQKEIKLPPKEIVSVKDRFFFFPTRIFKPSGESSIKVGRVNNCKKVKYYYYAYEDNAPSLEVRVSDEIVITSDYYYEQD